MPLHPRTMIVNSMARTFYVLAYADWVDAWNDAGNRPDRPAEAMRPAVGGNWQDYAPGDPAADFAALRRGCHVASKNMHAFLARPEWDNFMFFLECIEEAACLYGRIVQLWGADPWVVLQACGFDTDDARERWAHYAVLSCIGVGCCWEDDHEELTWDGTPRTLTEGIGDVEVPTWDGPWPDDAPPPPPEAEAHALEPWSVVGGDFHLNYILCGADHGLIADFDMIGGHRQSKANVARTLACVNALAGVKDPVAFVARARAAMAHASARRLGDYAATPEDIVAAVGGDEDAAGDGATPPRLHR